MVESDWLDGDDNGDYNSTGLVGISKVFVLQDSGLLPFDEVY